MCHAGGRPGFHCSAIRAHGFPPPVFAVNHPTGTASRWMRDQGTSVVSGIWTVFDGGLWSKQVNQVKPTSAFTHTISVDWGLGAPAIPVSWCRDPQTRVFLGLLGLLSPHNLTDSQTTKPGSPSFRSLLSLSLSSRLQSRRNPPPFFNPPPANWSLSRLQLRQVDLHLTLLLPPFVPERSDQLALLSVFFPSHIGYRRRHCRRRRSCPR